MNWVKNSLCLAIGLIGFLSIYADMIYAPNGDEFLRQGNYDKAIESYEAEIKQGFIGHQLFFNLGTAYAKKGIVDKALLNFEKAHRLKPLDKVTKSEIINLNLKLQDKPPVYEDTGLLAFFKKVQFSLSIDAWAFLSILFMIMLALVIFISYRFQKMKGRQLVFLSSILWFILSGFSVVMARNNYHFKYLHSEGIVNKESIKVFDRAEVNSVILFNLHSGTKVEIDDSSSNMYHIQFAEKEGWIINKDVQKIEL
jgi:tetratricopeptide (TPR) repeat protein